jgi:hypothetical protein
MSLPDQTPKLPKLPFLIGDGALLAAAWYVAAQARHPLPLEQTLAIVGCVLGGGLIGVIPFLTDYARRQDEALDDRQRGLEALARTVASSAEQISIAAQGLQEITVLAQKNLQDAGQLQEKMAGIPPRAEAGRGAEKQKADKELAAALAAKTDRLEEVAEQIAKGAADWARADGALQKLMATLEKLPTRAAARSKAEPAAPTIEESEPPAPPPSTPPEEKVPEAKAPEAPKWESEPEPLPAPAATDLPAEPAAAASLPLDLPLPVAVPKAPRKPRKPKAESVPAAPATAVAAPEAAEEPAPPAAAAPASSEFSQVSPEEAAPAAAVSSDGSTRLLVTAYIGIGNRLFIRGEGPGLSWEKGVPLQFVSIGKWRWESAEASSPVRFRLYKNDEIECVGLGEGRLEPGRQQELTAAF